ncbi:hypothetical protein B9Z55_025863 [Caenorhabditis nigoni]|uniref:Uncharacterized protein n=1 Tax=Caenorhabditis nigoni TaxID=1611254 RepID=A0A2G5T0S0_9PELO|nr:hypothetical protein B9Z55_025863 [Caenorhabditis nigoni]
MASTGEKKKRGERVSKTEQATRAAAPEQGKGRGKAWSEIGGVFCLAHDPDRRDYHLKLRCIPRFFCNLSLVASNLLFVSIELCSGKMYRRICFHPKDPVSLTIRCSLQLLHFTHFFLKVVCV